MPSSSAGRAPAGIVLVLVLVAVSGCGFLQDLADPHEPPPATTLAPEPGAGPVAGPPEDGPVVLVDGTLRGTGSGGGGHLTVTALPVQTGLVPPVPNFSDSCPVEGPSLQYLPVEVAFTAVGLAAHVAVERGPATPADAGDIGIVVESGDGTERYCFDYPPLPTTDRFWHQMGAATITGYVVLDDAVTAATPEGRAAVFPTVQLRISDLRVFTDPERVRRLTVGDLTVGAPCPDDPDAICVPLG